MPECLLTNAGFLAGRNVEMLEAVFKALEPISKNDGVGLRNLLKFDLK